jgi:hypothetical protein
MTIIDHGAWERYTPASTKDGMPPNVMYARRIGSGEDWYEYVKARRFGDGSVVMTVMATEAGSVVQAATFDPTAVFPAEFSVIEETAYSGNDPQSDLGQRSYNADARKIGGPFVWPDPAPTPTETKILDALDAIVKRLEKLEHRK